MCCKSLEAGDAGALRRGEPRVERAQSNVLVGALGAAVALKRSEFRSACERGGLFAHVRDAVSVGDGASRAVLQHHVTAPRRRRLRMRFSCGLSCSASTIGKRRT
jgi:hypothetical protein